MSENPNELREIAARVNAGGTSIDGLVSCSVDTESPPVLAYSFDTPESALRFKSTADATQTTSLYTIYPFRPAVVFELRAVCEVDAMWHRLLHAHEAASAAYVEAFAHVSREFGAVARGAREAPAANPLDASDAAWARWQAVRREMDEFVREHTGPERR